MKQFASCRARWHAVVGAFLLGILFLSVGTVAQNPILDFSLDRETLTLPIDGSAVIWLRVSNTSVHEADDIEVVRLGGPVDLEEVTPMEVLDAFSDARIPLALSTADDAVEGGDEVLFELSYTYCIGDLCFQIVEELTLRLEFVAAVIGPEEDTVAEPFIYSPASDEANESWVLPIILALCLGLALIAGKIWGRRRWVVALLVGLILAALSYGIVLHQDQQAQSIGAVLCTSCVGIEETPHEEPVLSEQARSRIAELSDDIELLFFTATWCHACPYAKAMVQQVVDINPRVSVQLIDVDESPGAAAEYGIVQSGRTIVPAILRVDTGDVIFGIEGLERRLLALLEVSP